MHAGIHRQWNNRIAPIPVPVPVPQVQAQVQQDALWVFHVNGMNQLRKWIHLVVIKGINVVKLWINQL